MQYRFEMIKRVHLTLVPFSPDNGTLTPTLKIKRRDAANLYKGELEALYALGEPSGTKNSFKLWFGHSGWVFVAFKGCIMGLMVVACMYICSYTSFFLYRVIYAEYWRRII